MEVKKFTSEVLSRKSWKFPAWFKQSNFYCNLHFKPALRLTYTNGTLSVAQRITKRENIIKRARAFTD